MATPTTTINMHPKLFTGMLVGLAVAAIGGITNALSPDLFAALGVWGPPAFSIATVALSALAGWLKRVNAPEPAVSPAPAAPTPAPVATVAPAPVAPPTTTVTTDAPISVRLVSDAVPGTQSNVIA